TECIFTFLHQLFRLPTQKQEIGPSGQANEHNSYAAHSTPSELAPFSMDRNAFGPRQPGRMTGYRIGQDQSAGLHAKLLNQSVNYALRTSWRRSGPTIMVSDNFLDQLIWHRVEESVKGTSRHRRILVARERVFGF